MASSADGIGQVASVHRPVLELSQPFPPEVEAGVDVAVNVRVSCPLGCDLRGGQVKAAASEEAEVAAFTCDLGGAERGGTGDILLQVPRQVGEGVWVITFPGQEVRGVIHEEGVLTLRSTVVPHATSMAVWDVPSPVRGSRFSIRVGIKCSAQCRLGGELVEVRDDAGVLVGEGRLGSEPWPGTMALYSTIVELTAPDRSGMFPWFVSFVATEAELPHRPATSGAFSFRSVEPPEHTVTVEVLQEGTEAPVENVEVRLSTYRAETNERGVARLEVPKGAYELAAWTVDLESTPTRLEVAGDITVRVKVVPRPVVDEDETRMWA